MMIWAYTSGKSSQSVIELVPRGQVQLSDAMFLLEKGPKRPHGAPYESVGVWQDRTE